MLTHLQNLDGITYLAESTSFVLMLEHHLASPFSLLNTHCKQCGKSTMVKSDIALRKPHGSDLRL
jgi:hypothetical protein